MTVMQPWSPVPGRLGWMGCAFMVPSCPHCSGITQGCGDRIWLTSITSVGEAPFTAGIIGQGEMEPGTSTKEPVLCLQGHSQEVRAALLVAGSE